MLKLVSSVRLPGERRYLRTTERNQLRAIVLSLGSLRGPLPPPPCAVGRGSPPGFEPGPPSPFSASIQVDVGVQREPSGLARRALPFLRNLVITAKLGSGSQLAATGSFVFISSLKSTFKKQQHNHIAVFPFSLDPIRQVRLPCSLSHVLFCRDSRARVGLPSRSQDTVLGPFLFGRVLIMALVIMVVSEVRPKDVSQLDEPLAGHLGLLVFSTA